MLYNKQSSLECLMSPITSGSTADKVSRVGYALSNKLTSAQIVFDFLCNKGVEDLRVRIWINNCWMRLSNVYASEERVRETWLQNLTNTIRQLFFIVGDMNR